MAPEVVESHSQGGSAGFRAWFSVHRASIVALACLLSVVGFANGWNLQGWPGRVNDDEGTYVAEAWAMLAPHHLSNYTYWYDHPPLGWAQIAAYAWLTDGFDRYPSAVMLGREFMWVVNLTSCALLYLLARRLKFRRVFAAISVAVFGLSPLAIYFHRMVFLDNPAIMWTLLSLVLAASPRRSLRASLWCGVSFAIACLSKETIGLFLPAVVWMLWQHTDRETRRWNMGTFAGTFVMIMLGYPLFAALRGELFPGPGHVSLLGSLAWQLFQRSGSGSVFNPHSVVYGLASSWIRRDPWFLPAGVVLTPVAFAIRRLRPLALGLGVEAVILLRGGYVPYMFVIGMLPCAALIMAGVADTWWAPLSVRARGRHSAVRATPARLCRRTGRVLVIVAAILLTSVVVPQWWAALDRQSTLNGAASEMAATAWIDHSLPKSSIVVVDDYMWTDIKRHGKAYPVWCWKVSSDPWVRWHVLPRGYESINYIVLPAKSSCMLDLNAIPTLKFALAHSRIVKNFGGGITARVIVTKRQRRHARRREHRHVLPPAGGGSPVAGDARRPAPVPVMGLGPAAATSRESG